VERGFASGTLGQESMNDGLARIAGDSRSAQCLSPALRAKISLTLLT
jgi:hypothetical protein